MECVTFHATKLFGQNVHYYRHLAMIFPSRKPIGKQADQTDGASGGCHQGRPGRNPAPRTSARSNGTTSFSTASTSSIVPGSAKERVLMLYFNTNVGATLTRLSVRVFFEPKAVDPLWANHLDITNDRHHDEPHANHADN